MNDNMNYKGTCEPSGQNGKPHVGTTSGQAVDTTTFFQRLVGKQTLEITIIECDRAEGNGNGVSKCTLTEEECPFAAQPRKRSGKE